MEATVYLGVSDDGIVVGLPISEDQVRVYIHHLIIAS